MHCGRVSNLLSAYIDRELAGAEMLQIRRHLDDCPACFSEYESLGRVKSLLAFAPPVEPSGDVTAAVMQRWAQRREQPPASRPSWQWRWKWMDRPRRWQHFGLAFTSGCLAVVLAGTALALRKPNYPDAVAANVLPSLQQSDKTLSMLEPFDPRYDRSPPEAAWRPWAPSNPRPNFWWNGAGGAAHPMLVSEMDGAPGSWGR